MSRSIPVLAFRNALALDTAPHAPADDVDAPFDDPFDAAAPTLVVSRPLAPAALDAPTEPWPLPATLP